MTSGFIELIQPSELAVTPWKNGAGTTVELAAGPLHGPLPLWRFSIATLTEETTRFSPFPGMDRVFTVIGDAGVHLAFPSTNVDARPWHPVPFPGSDGPVCTPLAATRAFNVMVDSARASANVVAADLSDGSVTTDDEAVTLVLVRSGNARAGSVRAAVGECLLVRGSSTTISGDAGVLVARVVHAELTPV